MRRQLLCVVFADMAGYSAMTSRDEVGTHDMWRGFIEEVVDPVTEEEDGAIVRTLGDGILLTFGSATNAANWAITIQNRINEGRAGNRRHFPGLSLRIAVHICEVISDGNDIYGDGVNTTKRLQESIGPDGIILSEDLYNSIRKSQQLEVKNLGYLTLRNISDPIRAFELISRSTSPGVGLLQAKAELPSIGIIPLKNLSPDREFDYFADGVVEDLITSLSGLKELVVISRTSTLAFSGTDADPREIGRILDVRYVLMGTLRRSPDRIRISVNLCDTSNGEIIYSEKSDFSHKDIFETQDKIVEHVVSHIAPNVRQSERVKALRKPPDSFTAYDLTLKALDFMSVLTKESFDQASICLDQAIAIDPDFAMAAAQAARMRCIYIGQGWSEDREATSEQAWYLAQRAVDLDRQSALGLAAFGHIKSYLSREYETALVFLDRAREVGPSLPLAWIYSAGTLSYVGRAKEAIEHAQYGIRLSPNDPELFQYYDFLAIAYYLNREFELAYQWSERSFAEKQDYTSNWRVMTMTAAAAGQMARAREFAAKISSADPDFTVDHYMQAVVPFREPKDRDMVEQHLRAAGLP